MDQRGHLNQKLRFRLKPFSDEGFKDYFLLDPLLCRARGFMSSGTETHAKQRPFLYQLNLSG